MSWNGLQLFRSHHTFPTIKLYYTLEDKSRTIYWDFGVNVWPGIDASAGGAYDWEGVGVWQMNLFLSGPLSPYSLSTDEGGVTNTQHLSQPCYRYPTVLGVLAIAMRGDTPVGFQSNKPMESITANCADRFLAVSSYGQTMSDRCVDKVQAYEWRRAKSWVFHNQRIKLLSLSATTLALVEEGRGDNLRFKD